ncbi:Adenylate cyclase [Minicystis rosea]|nr:Adenylate cyclase [Minicystis rosea]
MRSSMRPGQVIGGRFELQRLAGTGGMGAVFQGLDRETGASVAIKVLRGSTPAGAARLSREARALASLDHPAIVRHVTHGLTPEHEPYLVMEWLDGEDLAALLERRRLDVAETLSLGVRIAEALGAMHARGIVHRDVKPSNIFLVGGEVSAAKILDLGLVRPDDHTQLTQTGAFVGTLGYMAPEQARAGQSVDARADVFSLGCVLFKCVTGTAVFEAEKVMAILAKILLEKPPLASERCLGLPPDLDALLARMLSKEPADRPRDGREAAAALGAVRTDGPGIAAPSPALSLTVAERRLISMVLVAPPEDLHRAVGDGETAEWTALLEVAEALGAQAERLADGTLAVLLTGSWVATDQAAQAARCALSIRALAPDRRIGLATARSELSVRTQVSDAIDRTVRLLASTDHGDGTAPLPIAVDEVTAGLLGPRFLVRSLGNRLALLGEGPEQEPTLLGRPTTLVGRERELRLLETLFAECIEEPLARAVLVTAPPGVGKSRLVRELLRVVERRDEAVSVWQGQGDLLRTGSALGLLRAVLRGVLGLHEGEPIEVRRRKVRARVAQHVPEAARARTAAFLGELVAVPFPDDETPALVAARRDPELMGEQMARAWEDFLRAECAVRPVLLVLDDLQWGDLPSARFIDSALRRLGDQPFMVLALGRPEVDTLFPKLWEGRKLQRINLEELGRRASEKLVRQVLGDDVSPETMERVVTLAGGHAFYLEELIRAVAAGQRSSLPETVLAMVEARLGALDPEARRLLRAASVFGDVQWSGGVAALLGGALSPAETRRALSALAEQELLVERPDSRFPGESELAFRHALLREGAYTMLTDEDRILGHRLAARWLEEHGESDAMVLAEHLERGDDRARAGVYYLRAAEQANRGGDTDAAIARARRGLECDVAVPDRVALLGLLCDAHGWRREWLASAVCGEEVLRIGEPGTTHWMVAAASRLVVSQSPRRIDDFMDALVAAADRATDAAQIAYGMVNGSFFLAWSGRSDLAEQIQERFRTMAAPVVDRDPVVRGFVFLGEALRTAWGGRDPWTGTAHARIGRAAFATIEHRRGVALAQWILGLCLWMLGESAEAERELATILEFDLGMGSSFRNLCHVFSSIESGAVTEAERRAADMIALASTPELFIDAARGHVALAAVLQKKGDLAGAERELRTALVPLTALPLERGAALAMLATVLLGQDRAGEALVVAEEAVTTCRDSGAFGFRGTLARVAWAEALRAHDRAAEASAILTEVGERLRAQAAQIDDPEARRAFLERVPENARALARERDDSAGVVPL